MNRKVSYINVGKMTQLDALNYIRKISGKPPLTKWRYYFDYFWPLTPIILLCGVYGIVIFSLWN